MLYIFKNKFKLRKIKTLTFITLAACLLSGNFTFADTQKTRNSQKEKFIKENKPIIAAITVAGGTFIILGVYLVTNKEANNENQNQNQNSSKYGEERQIIRMPTNKLVNTLPLIYEQELKKLNYLKTDVIKGLKTDLKNEINDDIDEFLATYLLKEYQVEIQKDPYYGLAMISFRKDIKSDKHVYITCFVKVQKWSKNDEFSDIKKNLANDMIKELKEKFTNAIQTKTYREE